MLRQSEHWKNDGGWIWKNGKWELEEVSDIKLIHTYILTYMWDK
jgi:hypothetical protein